MAEIKVDKKDERYRDDDRHERKFPWWLLAIPLLGLLLLPSLWNNDRDERATVDNQQQTASSVNYQGTTWQAAGNPVRLEDNQLRVVGRTADGQSIYSSAMTGGGGGQVATNDGVQQFYLRLNSGLYQPLRQTGVRTGEE
jgi:hypothetical protein